MDILKKNEKILYHTYGGKLFLKLLESDQYTKEEKLEICNEIIVSHQSDILKLEFKIRNNLFDDHDELNAELFIEEFLNEINISSNFQNKYLR